MQANEGFRLERDCLGEMQLPNTSYWGIQTERMRHVSGVARLPIIFYPGTVYALAEIKTAAAKANASIGVLEEDIARAIVQASDEVIAGQFDGQFPLDMWQGGGYTCLNMNVNEVIGNRANEILTGHKGQDRVHPNTHVNKAQSTNDTIPSATHLAIAPQFEAIVKELRLMEEAFRAKSAEFAQIVKVGRTCWQDALPLTLGQEFSGFAELMRRLANKLTAHQAGCDELVMGGSAVGTGLGADPGYQTAFYRYLSESLGRPIKPMVNLFDGFQNPDFFVTTSGLIKEVATSISKISKDLRLMSSGPRAGWQEIELPALSPGSSIMPGKINPTVPEMVIQVAHQVMGNDIAISIAYDEGRLDLNVWDATFYKCLFESMQLVEGSLKLLRTHCVEGIKANSAHCAEEANGSIALSTVTAALFDYPTGVKVAHYAQSHRLNVKEAVVEMGLMNEEEAEKMIDPLLMTDPDKMAQALATFREQKKSALKNE